MAGVRDELRLASGSFQRRITFGTDLGECVIAPGHQVSLRPLGALLRALPPSRPVCRNALTAFLLALRRTSRSLCGLRALLAGHRAHVWFGVETGLDDTVLDHVAVRFMSPHLALVPVSHCTR